jgi:NTE family protein
VALGHGAAAVEERFKAAFDEETVAGIFPGGPFGAGAAGLEALTRMLQEATEEKSFADAVIPLVIMAVDLTDRAAIPIRDGPLWQALVSALAVAGVFPTQERDGHRLVDAIALVPVPTASVVEGGADIVVSCNLMGAETLDRWPEGPEIPPPPEKKRRGPLDTMLEVMDLSQLDTSTRLAALADVAVTPKFAPVDWRDFHLADLFLAAGRAAALEQVPRLQALSRPVQIDQARRESGLTTFV